MEPIRPFSVPAAAVVPPVGKRTIEMSDGASPEQRKKGSRIEPRTFPDLSKLFKNGIKAIKERLSRDPSHMISDAAIPPLDSPSIQCEFTTQQATLKGSRIGKRTNEDRALLIEKEASLFAGIFDGHNGSDISELARDFFEEYFYEELKAQQGDVKKAFNEVAKKLDDDIKIQPQWASQGTTAGILFVDKEHNLVYNATLADTEAMIYRKCDGAWKAIPLSCVRNWSSKSDIARAEKASPGFASQVKDIPVKQRRFGGLNVSRAFGDIDLQRFAINNTRAISPKFKISVQKILPGDIIISASDGLWDFVKNEHIVAILNAPGDLPLANRLASYAQTEGRSSDDISVITIYITPVCEKEKGLSNPS